MQDNHFANVGAIVIRNGQVLLVRHTYGSAEGKLLNPGGRLHEGEMPEDAVIREVLEETGVTVTPVGVLSLKCSTLGWYLVFLADYVSGEPDSDGDENSEALFMDCDEALARADTTNTLKELLRLALAHPPIRSEPANRGQVYYSVGEL